MRKLNGKQEQLEMEGPVPVLTKEELFKEQYEQEILLFLSDSNKKDGVSQAEKQEGCADN